MDGLEAGGSQKQRLTAEALPTERLPRATTFLFRQLDEEKIKKADVLQCDSNRSK